MVAMRDGRRQFFFKIIRIDMDCPYNWTTVFRVGGKDVFMPLAEKHFTHLLMVLIH